MMMKYITQYLRSSDWFRQVREMFIVSKVLRDGFMARRKSVPRTDEMLECNAGLLKGAMFFLGLSIENALKGVCIGVAPDVKLTHSHDLRNLASKTNMSFFQDELILLDRLTSYIKWAGRYHVPLEKNADQLDTRRRMIVPNDFLMAKEMLVAMKVFGE